MERLTPSVSESFVDENALAKQLVEEAKVAFTAIVDMDLPGVKPTNKDVVATLEGRGRDASWGTPIIVSAVEVVRDKTGQEVKVTSRHEGFMGQGNDMLRVRKLKTGKFVVNIQSAEAKREQTVSGLEGLNPWDIRRLPAVVRHIQNEDLKLKRVTTPS